MNNCTFQKFTKMRWSRHCSEAYRLFFDTSPHHLGNNESDWMSLCISLEHSSDGCPVDRPSIANIQKLAVAGRREPEPTTGRRNEVGLAVPQATIELLAESCRQ